MKILMIDNFDSFTFNLVEAFRQLDVEVVTYRNDVSLDVLRRVLDGVDRVVLSPGPGRPEEAGVALDLVEHIASLERPLPVLGVCLGHQILAKFAGAEVVRAPQILHGKVSRITHDGRGIFAGLPSPMSVGRYHSLCSTQDHQLFEISANAEGVVMAARHRTLPFVGVQFHPESILTPDGQQILENFLGLEATVAQALEPVAVRETRAFDPMIFERISEGEGLAEVEAHALFSSIVDGRLDAVEVASILGALKIKGETPTEIAGAARALTDAALPFPDLPFALADTCGTGGDGAHTVNISTAAAFVAAACGMKIAKHGNRSISSKCGSADVLEACGVRLDLDPARSGDALREIGVTFLMAPQYHSGMRHVAGVRKTLKTRTIFNLLGPLVNPARPEFQVVGVYDPALCRPLCETLRLLGARSAMVVHGSGLDEIALHASTHACRLENGVVSELELHPEDFGAERADMNALRGGGVTDNAAALRAILCGKAPRAHLHAVAINVSALLVVAGHVENFEEGFGMAMSAMKSGDPLDRLERLANFDSSIKGAA